MTTDRQKKQLHHHVSGMECTGDVRGLAGLPQMATEELEEKLVAGGTPWELWDLNPKLVSSAYSTRA